MNEKVMNEKIDEQISALVDGELGSDEQDFLLRRLANDKSLQGKWHRYNLISDALQNHLPDLLDVGLTKKISNALEKEDSLHTGNLQTGNIKSKLVKSVAGLSIAASVAVFSVIGLQQYNLLQVQDDIGAVNLASSNVSSLVANNQVAKNPATGNLIPDSKTLAIISRQDMSPVYVRVSGTRWDNEQPQIGSRLNNYLVNHNEYTSSTNLQGLVNYSRIAGYDIK